MGLKWSSPILVKSGTLYLCISPMPKCLSNNNCGECINCTRSSDLWLLWKIHKKKIKEDGFGISKKGYNWNINYFAKVEEEVKENYDEWEDISDDSGETVISLFGKNRLMEVDSGTGKTYLEMELMDKILKWQGEMEKIKKIMIE